MSDQPMDTPLSADTPEATQSTGIQVPPKTQADLDHDLIKEDLGLDASDDSDYSLTPEHPDSERMMRADYLKKLNQLNAERERLAAEREQLEQLRVQMLSGDDDDDDSYDVDDDLDDLLNEIDGETRRPTAKTSRDPLTLLAMNLADEIDPSQFFDSEVAELAEIVKNLAEQVHYGNRLGLEIAQKEIGRMSQAQKANADVALSVMNATAPEIERAYGIKVSADDIGEALVKHADLIIANGGQVDIKVAMEAWKRENVDVILAAVEGKRPIGTSTVPQVSASGVRGVGTPMTDEQKILADLGLG